MRNLVGNLAALLPGRAFATKPAVAMRIKTLNLPDWATLLDTNRALWDDAKKRARNGPRVLIATSVGGLSAMSVIESFLSVALTLRGARVHVLLCDRALPACLRAEKPEVPDPNIFREYGFNQHRLCQECPELGRHIYDPLGLQVHFLGETISGASRLQARCIAAEVPFKDIERYRLNGWSVGEHAYAGVLRYFASGNLNNEPDGEMVVRHYFEGALLTAFGVDALLRKHRFSAACFHHGIYSPQGVIGEMCRNAGVRVVNWNVAYRKRCFIFSHDDTYHHTLMDEPTKTWEDLPWNAEMEREVMDYLKSRWQGTRDWIWFHEKPDEDAARFTRELGVDPGKPIIGMLTNVMWDAQLHYRANAFPDMLTWAVKTIEYFAGRPDLQLLIRVHPAEIRGGLPSRQFILDEIKKVYPVLPKNVFAIPPDSPISTYAAMSQCDAVIIYGTKTGVELTSMGIPVIVGGEAWIRNKGLTLDASSPEEYVSLLERLPLRKRLDDDTVRRARKYAYHFFFRRMIPLASIVQAENWPPYKIDVSTLDQLLPGCDPGLDTVCSGILNGEPFTYPAEALGISEFPANTPNSKKGPGPL